MQNNNARQYVLSVLMLSGIPMLSNAHTDHPEEAIHNTIINFITYPTVLASIAAVALLACIFWLCKEQHTKQAIALSVVSVLVVLGAVSLTQPSEQTAVIDEALFAGHTDMPVTLYKDPSCGCCEGYAAALRRQGFAVTVEETSELEAIKAGHNIPVAGSSCHTSVIGGYVVEGHVPMAALAKLLEEQPDVAGIGLAGMPIGTPGMPGLQRAPYDVYQLSEAGEMSPYLSI